MDLILFFKKFFFDSPQPVVYEMKLSKHDPCACLKDPKKNRVILKKLNSVYSLLLLLLCDC